LAILYKTFLLLLARATSQDAVEANRSGNWYKLSGEFKNGFHDLYHWRMNNGFFSIFPAIVDDILPTNTIPQHVSLWSEADLLRVRRSLHKEDNKEKFGSYDI
jgi:hypothetical protein